MLFLYATNMRKMKAIQSQNLKASAQKQTIFIRKIEVLNS